MNESVLPKGAESRPKHVFVGSHLFLLTPSLEVTELVLCRLQSQCSAGYRVSALQVTELVLCRLQSQCSAGYRVSALQVTESVLCRLQSQCSAGYRVSALQVTESVPTTALPEE